MGKKDKKKNTNNNYYKHNYKRKAGSNKKTAKVVMPKNEEIKSNVSTEEQVKEIKKEEQVNKRSYLYNVIILTVVTFLIEIVFRLISEYDVISYESIRILISTIILSLIISIFATLSKKRWVSRLINYLYIIIYSIYSWLQLGFLSYLGVYMSFNTSSQFGAVKDYIGEFLNSIPFHYYFIFIPLILYIVFDIVTRKKITYSKFIPKKTFVIIPTLLFLFICYYLTLSLKFMQNPLQVKNNLDLFVNPDVPTIAVSEFGTMTFGITDLRTFIFPSEEVDETLVFNTESGTPNETSREVSSCLNELALNDNNSKYKKLNQYFSTQQVTDYNDSTGLLKGKNVIFILMESINEGIIDEVNFPNFYYLYSNGYHWVNNYSPRNSCATGNNEFSAMTSLYSVYNTCTTNTYKDNKYYESVFGLFNDADYYTTSMHPFNEWYYKRSVFHINMGSQKYYGAKQLKIKTYEYGNWPSDEEFMDKALDILLSDNSGKPFMTWFTTITSHQPYSNSSIYGDKYFNDFRKQGYSKSVSRYLSKVKVLDNGLGIMIDKLKEAGKLDDTVIVLTGDHYPYGLSKSSIEELLKKKPDKFDIEKTPFVIYNSSLTPTEFTEYTSYINIVPTVANLFDLEYDPRLYVGSDLLSDSYQSVVIFADGSWKNEYGYYSASKSKGVCYDDSVCNQEYIKNMNVIVRNKIDMSSKAIKSNYFIYLEKELNKCEEEKKNN